MQQSPSIVKIGFYIILLVPVIIVDPVLFPSIFGKALFFQIIIELIIPFWIALFIWYPAYRPVFSRRYYSINIAIVVFLIVSLFSAIVGAYPLRSFWGSEERMTGVFTLLHFGAWYFMLVSVLRTKREWIRYLRALVALGATISAFMIYRGIAGIETQVRPQAWFGNPGIAGTFLLFLIFFIPIAWLLERNGERKKIAAFFYGISWLAATGALIFNDTRAVFVGIFGAILLGLFGFPLWQKKKGNGKLPPILLGLLGAACVVFASLAVTDRLPQYFYSSIPILSRVKDISLKDNVRIIVWDSGLKGWKNRPILGYGPENYAIPFNMHYNPVLVEGGSSYQIRLDFDKAHNEFVEHLVTGGVIGFLAWAAIFIIVLLRLFQHRKQGFVYVLLSLLFIAYLIHLLLTFDTPSSWFMLMIALALSEYLTRDERTIPKQLPIKISRHSLGTFLVTASVVLAVVLLYAGNLKSAVASHLSLLANATAQKKDFKTAMLLFYGALKRGSPYSFDIIERTSAEILNIVDSYDKDQREELLYLIQEMKKIEKNNWHVQTLIARAYNILCNGDKNYCKEALLYLDKAEILAPTRPMVYAERYVTYNVLGDFTKAKLEADRALELGYAPYSAPIFINLGFLYGYHKEYDKSLMFYEKALEVEPRNTDILKSIIFVADQMGDSVKARETAKKALEIDPTLEGVLQKYLE